MQLIVIKQETQWQRRRNAMLPIFTTARERLNRSYTVNVGTLERQQTALLRDEHNPDPLPYDQHEPNRIDTIPDLY